MIIITISTDEMVQLMVQFLSFLTALRVTWDTKTSCILLEASCADVQTIVSDETVPFISAHTTSTWTVSLWT